MYVVCKCCTTFTHVYTRVIEAAAKKQAQIQAKKDADAAKSQAAEQKRLEQEERKRQLKLEQQQKASQAQKKQEAKESLRLYYVNLSVQYEVSVIRLLHMNFCASIRLSSKITCTNICYNHLSSSS